MDSFFGIGVFELVFIIIFALIFLGPERLPGALREVIGVLRKVRDISSEVTQQFSDEFGDLQDLQDLDPRRQIQKAIYEPKKKSPAKKESAASKKTASNKKTATQKNAAQAKPQKENAEAKKSETVTETATEQTTMKETTASATEAQETPASDTTRQDPPEPSAPPIPDGNRIAPPQSVPRQPKNGTVHTETASGEPASDTLSSDESASATEAKRSLAEEEQS